MKVLHLFDAWLPHTMNWAYRILDATPDVQVQVAAPWMMDNGYLRDDYHFYIPKWQQWMGNLPKNEWQMVVFRRILLKIEQFFPIYNRQLEKQIRVQKPDLLHAHFGPVACRYLSLAKKTGIPLVVSFYGYDYEKAPFRQPALRARYHELFEHAAAITAAGPRGKAVLMAQGCPEAKIFISPMSMRPEEFPPQRRFKEPGQLKLVQVATITGKKGFMDTLQAFQMALARCPNLELTLAGERHDDALVAAIKNFIRQQQLESKVQWLEFIPHGDLAGFLQDFEVFIQPSHYTEDRDCEGGPVSILEAQSGGMPVICTRHFDMPTEVLHEQTGLLAEERDIAGLAACIERFYWMDAAVYQTFSRNAAAHVRDHFDIRQTGKRLFDLYKNILKIE
ncbi:MAG: glycosyltransferase [Chitinophagales bacterium]|nr:glycosyltransferase [Chitinophagales bacterium]